MKKESLKRVWRIITAQRLLLWRAIACAVLYVPLLLLGPIFIGRAIDGIVGAGQVDFNVVGRNLLLLAATAGAAALLQWLMLVCARQVSAAAAQELRRQAFNAINQSPLSRIDTHPHGDLVSRLVNDADAVGEGLLQAVNQLLPGAVTILATIIMMLGLNIPIALVVIVITPISVLFARFIAGRTSRYFHRQSAAQGAMSAQVMETVNAQALVRAYGAEQQTTDVFEALSGEYHHTNFKATFYSSISNPSTRFINALVYSAVGLSGTLLAVAGGITVGGISTFLSYANQYTKPFNEVSAVLTQMQAAAASAVRLFEVIDWPPEQPDAPDSAWPDASRGEVTAKQVYFSYLPDKPLIQDFNLQTTSGQRIALVGPTGCGKTTIINLLMRFYEVDKGRIEVDGCPSTHVARNALRGLYGMVLQDTWLKKATVRDNIRYSHPGATQQEVEAAAKMALAHRFIMRLPNGYDTILETGGDNLSAGQQQLLCIARLMLAKPDMLILDEATSSIDTRTEMLIQRALEKLMEGHTSFIVAHRLSTIKSADRILVMDSGRIIEQGTHRQLLEQNGFYAQLYQSQFAVE